MCQFLDSRTIFYCRYGRTTWHKSWTERYFDGYGKENCSIGQKWHLKLLNKGYHRFPWIISPRAPILNTLGTSFMTFNSPWKLTSHLKVAMGGTPFLAYRQPPKLKLHFFSSRPPNSYFHRPKCQLWLPHQHRPHIAGQNNRDCNIWVKFTCSSANITYAITCSQCLFAIYIG